MIFWTAPTYVQEHDFHFTAIYLRAPFGGPSTPLGVKPGRAISRVLKNSEI